MMNVGSVRITGQPAAKTVSETLALLQVVGGGEKGVRKLLEKLQEVQTHNEQVLSEARIAKKEAELAETKFDNAYVKANNAQMAAQTAQNNLRLETKAVNQTLDERNHDVASAEAALNTQKAAFEMKMRTETGILTQSRNDLTKRSIALKKREAEYVAMKNALQITLQEFVQIGERIARATAQAKHVVSG